MTAITDFFTNLLTTTSDGVSPGVATTEFIATVVTSGIVLFGLNLSVERKGALVTLIAIAYVVGRSIVKALAASNPPKK